MHFSYPRFFLFSIACAAILTGGPVRAGEGESITAWKTFFRIAVPAAAHNFSALRGAFDSAQGDYAVKTAFNPKLVRNCRIFTTGAGDSSAWNLRCELSTDAGQAVGPATAQGPLTRALSAALPQFKRGTNLMGEPQWKGSNQIAVTVVFGGILITHGYNDV
jgi:hypothetical protein